VTSLVRDMPAASSSTGATCCWNSLADLQARARYTAAQQSNSRERAADAVSESTGRELLCVTSIDYCTVNFHVHSVADSAQQITAADSQNHHNCCLGPAACPCCWQAITAEVQVPAGSP
jgi:hypothetical protein